MDWSFTITTDSEKQNIEGKKSGSYATNVGYITQGGLEKHFYSLIFLKIT